MTCNGVPLTASRWLGDRDEVGVGSHRLRCEVSSETVALSLVQKAPSEMKFPEVEISGIPQASAAGRTITPTDFKPRWQSPPPRSRFSIRPRSLMMIAAVVLLAAGAFFVLTARAVRIETSPAAEQLDIRGGWLTPKFGDSYLLRPGSYTVAADLEGYRSLSETLEVNGDTPSVVGFVFEPLGGLLTIISSPVDGAEITIDGEAAGTTPAYEIELGAGEHTVEVAAPLHLPYRTTVVFEPGEPPRELAAVLVPNWALLTIATVARKRNCLPRWNRRRVDSPRASGRGRGACCSKFVDRDSNRYRGGSTPPPVSPSTSGSFDSCRWTAVSRSPRSRPEPP